MTVETMATILTIDDEEVIRRSFQAYLEDSGFKVLQAQNGRVGLEVFRREKPDAVLVDLRMPEMDGLEVLAHVVRESPEVPILVVSGTGMIQDAIEALRLGAWDYVLKPVEDLGILEHSLRQSLERARLLKENKAYRDNLEVLVRMRTAELHKRSQQLEEANKLLQQQIKERQAAQDKYRLIFENAVEGIFQADFRGLVLSVNPSMARILGYASPGELLDQVGDLWARLFTEPGKKEKFLRILQAHGSVSGFEFQTNGQGGEILWGSINARLVKDVEGLSLYFEGTLDDISNHKRFEEQLLHQSLHDSLTGLPNRVLFMDRLSQSINRCSRGHIFFAVLYLDVDRFKVINDSLGHALGDDFLVQMASRLRSIIREADTLARMGGDEFAVISEQVVNLNGATNVADRILEEMRKPFVVAGREIYTSVSIGIICCSGICGTPEEVLRDADLTMYRAKSQGKACYEVFDNKLQEQAIELLNRETEFRRAMARKEFELFYQPIIDLSSGQVASLEALVRWRHPKRGLVSPLEFIPIAEDNGQILPLGRWVLEEACHRLADLQVKFPKANPLCMSVNISAKQFLQMDLAFILKALLEETGLDPATVELEITESVVMEKGEASIDRLERLKTLGVKLFVDDFGTGYSSLAYLHRFPIDMLKIDKSFITEIDATGGHTEIVRAIAGLGLNLGLGLIAEGVETKIQLEAIKDMGCHRAQGFYFAKPLPVAELEEFLGKPVVGRDFS